MAALKPKAVSWQKRSLRLLTHLALAGGGLILVYPLIFSLLVGFFTTYEFATRPQNSLFPWPERPTLANYSVLFLAEQSNQFRMLNAEGGELSVEERSKVRMSTPDGSGAVKDVVDDSPTILFNSVARTVYITLFAVLTSLLGGYAFGRIKWKGRDKWFLVLLVSQMFPAIMSFIPQYLLLYRWPLAGGNDLFGAGGHGLFNSFGVYLYTFCAINIMGTFLVRQAFQRIPIEYDEAARMDGAGTFRILFRLLAPLQKPVLAFVAITTAIGTWNDWTVPFFFTSDILLQTMPGAIVKLTSLFTVAQDTPNYPLIITLGLAITIPSLVILAFFQRYIVEGLSSSGIKG